MSDNFRAETKRAIKGSGHTTKDVMFVGSIDGKFRLTWKEFIKISAFSYDGGHGSSKIAQDLIIYFYDKSHITRGEYNGSEWWEYNEPLIFNDDDESIKYDSLCVSQSIDNGHGDLISGGWNEFSLLNGVEDNGN